MAPRKYSDEFIEFIRTSYIDDKSSDTMIAEAIEKKFNVFVTREAVIGIRHRNGISDPGRKLGGRPVGYRKIGGRMVPAKRSAGPFHGQKVKEGKRAPQVLSPRPLPEPVTDPLFVQEIAQPSSGGITMMQLRSHTCRWPIWKNLHDPPPFLYCGEKIEEDSPYCPDHTKINRRKHGGYY